MKRKAIGLLLILAVVAGAFAWFLGGNGAPLSSPSPVAAGEVAELKDPRLIARGAYLARIGDCAACHTAQGGAAYAGGRLLATPFGAVVASNLTPDPATGIGYWNLADFQRALRDGVAPHGKLLYPVFPYTSFTKVDADDAKALFAYLHSLPPVAQPQPEATLRFPYNQRRSLVAWRAMYFRAGAYQPAPGKSAAWNRGAYLVQGLGHCNECHATRDALGATADSLPLGGGLMAAQGWYAPDLSMQANGGLAGWTEQDVIDLLKSGHTARSSAFGPMAEVVERSTQHLSDEDLHAVATYLASLPARPAAKPVTAAIDTAAMIDHGAKLYAANCADCHGGDGKGVSGVYPALDGNTAVTEPSGVNATRMVLLGGFAPLTAGQPRPYSMPPFAQKLSDADVAAVVSYIRQAWSNQAGIVQERDVNRSRNASLE